MRFRPLPILTLLTIPLVLILLALGNWQWQRYGFKKNLENSAPPANVSLETLISAPKEFQKIKIIADVGTKTIDVKTAYGGKYGRRIFTTAKTNLGTFILEHGFISDDEFAQIGAADKQNPLPHGKIEIDAVLRKSQKPNKYVAQNLPQTHQYFWPETKAIASELGIVSVLPEHYLTPKMMFPIGENANVPNPFADPKGATYVEPARHLGYALTWWGLAIGLIGVYIAMHIRAERLSLKPK